MFKILEIVGTSPKGFSEAVREAVEQVVATGETVHFFEVVEQRGAVREGKFKEFQVKLKVAVDAARKAQSSEKQAANICVTCLQPVSEKGHLCVPVTGKDTKCDWCGALIPNERHLCDEKVKELAYICNSCGRTAVRAEFLCSPKKIK